VGPNIVHCLDLADVQAWSKFDHDRRADPLSPILKEVDEELFHPVKDARGCLVEYLTCLVN
jgi:hypothetical protein